MRNCTQCKETKKALSSLKIATLMLAIILLMSLGNIVVLSAWPPDSTPLNYSALRLNVDLSKITSVGYQDPTGEACACYALAYARTITDGRVHYFSEYNTYGTSQKPASANPSLANYYGVGYQTKREALFFMYKDLQNGKPVIACVTNSRLAQHFVTVVGVQNVTSFDTLSEDNFLILDPGGYTSEHVVESMSDRGYTLKAASGTTNPYLLYRAENTVNTVDFSSSISIGGNSNTSSDRYEVTNTKNVTGTDIVSQARTWSSKGATYWSGTTPWEASVCWRTGYTYNGQTSFDCSGFVGRVLNDCGFRSTNYTPSYGNCILSQTYGTGYIGISIEELVKYGTDITSSVQKAKNGDFSELQAGDIIGWTTGSLGRHIIIYAGLNNGTPWMVEFTGSGFLDRAVTSSYQQHFQYGARLVSKTDPSYLDQCTYYPSYCTIFVTKDGAKIRDLPCDETTVPSVNVAETASKLSIYTAVGLYKNTAGNLWYKVLLKNGSVGYIYSENVSFFQQNFDDCIGTGITAPSQLKVGTGFSNVGVITTEYQILKEVEAFVADSNGTYVTGGKQSVNAKTFDLYKSNIYYAVEFNKLAVGKNTYYVKATVECYYAIDKTTVGQKTKTFVIHETTFNVVSSTSCSHSYSSSVTLEPTCEVNGTRTYTCSKCGHSYLESITAKGHSYSVYVVPVTCTSDGYTAHICDFCDDQEIYDYQVALGHSFDEWYITKASSCTEDGEMRRDCIACDHYETKTYSSGGHKYVKTTVLPTCTEKGYTYQSCSLCGDYFIEIDSFVDEKGHSYDQWVLRKTPTYTLEGIETRDCINCDHYEIRYIPTLKPITVTKQPTSVSAINGAKIETTVVATGEDITYTWYYTLNKNGVEFYESSVTSATYTTTMDSTRDGRKVYCVITDKYGSTVTTDTVTLSMKSGLAITKQPTNVTVANGEKAATTVTATGEGLTYTWYYTSNGKTTEFYKSSVTGATYTTTMDATRDGRKVYCVITDKYGNSVTTNTVTLSMKSGLAITKQPTNVTVANGEKVATTVTATGEGLKYTWYYTSNGNTNQFFVSSVTGATYSTTMDATRDGRKVYCVITDKYGNSVTTNTVTLSMKSGLAITKQPTNVTAANGSKVETTVTATGEGLTYTWYYTSNGKTSQFYVSSVTGATYSTTMDATRDGRKVYCVITDKYGNTVKTNTVTLSMKSGLAITKQPTNVTVANGEKAATTVTATGEGLTYTWYYTSNGKTTEFYKSSVTGATYSTTMDSTRDGRKVYCVITDKYGNTVTTDIVTLTMK